MTLFQYRANYFIDFLSRNSRFGFNGNLKYTRRKVRSKKSRIKDDAADKRWKNVFTCNTLVTDIFFIGSSMFGQSLQNTFVDESETSMFVSNTSL